MRRHLRDANKNRIIETASGDWLRGSLALVAAGEKMGDGDEDDGAERCGCERVEEAAAENSELGENPSADQGADQTKDYIADAAEAAATGDLTSEPSGDEADEDPADESATVFDDDGLGREKIRKENSGHEASLCKRNCT
jgi:hypothetical protein